MSHRAVCAEDPNDAMSAQGSCFESEVSVQRDCGTVE
jgi:hypothetical protein